MRTHKIGKLYIRCNTLQEANAYRETFINQKVRFPRVSERRDWGNQMRGWVVTGFCDQATGQMILKSVND